MLRLVKPRVERGWHRWRPDHLPSVVCRVRAAWLLACEPRLVALPMSGFSVSIIIAERSLPMTIISSAQDM